MNGVHDLGGMQGFGAVELHDPELRFEYPWEAAAVAMQSAMERSVTNIDEFRHAIERMDPVHYLGSTYFEHWIESIITSCLEHGVFTADDLDSRESAHRANRVIDGAASAVASPARQQDAHPFRREPQTEPSFAVGRRVRTRNWQPEGHTRLARYVRSHDGVIAEYRGCFVYPDTNAHGQGESPQHLYSVRFTAPELWGDGADTGAVVFVDLFEPYLLPEA